MLEKIKEA